MTEARARAAAEAITDALARLSPGDQAALRRMRSGEAVPVFWPLVARHLDMVDREEQAQAWRDTVCVLALLTPGAGARLHNPRRRLGTVLCDGGDWSWGTLGQVPRPVMREVRFAALLASRSAQRGVLMCRAARTLARSMSPGSGVDVGEIAVSVLQPDARRHNEALARDYYSRLDTATRAVQQREGHT